MVIFMIDKEIVNTFKEVSLNFIGNSNSLHSLGLNSKKLEDAASKQIVDILRTNKEIVYTSSRNESNSLVIFGFLDKYKYRNKEVIVFKEVDNSIKDALEYMKKFGINVVYVDDISILKDRMNKNVVLVCCGNIDVEKIDNILKDYSAKLLIDITDSFDINFDFNMGDFIVFDSSSVNSIRGIAALLKNKNIVLEPLYHGGKSTTIYRSGTPFLPFIVSFSKGVKIMYKKMNNSHYNNGDENGKR